MLTDEEKQAIRAKVKEASGEWHFDLMMFANEIERAVLEKAMPIPKQEPDYWKIGGLGGDVITNKKSELDLAERFNWPVEPLYKHPHPAQAAAIPEQWRVTGYGQIKKGDLISMVIAGRRICTSAKEVLNAGTKKEEIVYNRKKNHYFITSMVLDGTSNHKDVFIIPSDSLSASPKPE